MPCNSSIHHRRSIRLKGYDYAQEGAYFVTILDVTQLSKPDAKNGVPTQTARVVGTAFLPSASLNHVQLRNVYICTHQRECLFGDIQSGEVALNDFGEIILNDWLRLPEFHPTLELDAFIIMPNHLHCILIINKTSPTHSTLGEIIRRFKIFTTKTINQHRKSSGVSIWHRDFYERIIRDETMYGVIREYINNNALKWSEDAENPAYVHYPKIRYGYSGVSATCPYANHYMI